MWTSVAHTCTVAPRLFLRTRFQHVGYEFWCFKHDTSYRGIFFKQFALLICFFDCNGRSDSDTNAFNPRKDQVKYLGVPQHLRSTLWYLSGNQTWQWKIPKLNVGFHRKITYFRQAMYDYRRVLKLETLSWAVDCHVAGLPLRSQKSDAQ